MKTPDASTADRIVSRLPVRTSLTGLVVFAVVMIAIVAGLSLYFAFSLARQFDTSFEEGLPALMELAAAESAAHEFVAVAEDAAITALTTGAIGDDLQTHLDRMRPRLHTGPAAIELQPLLQRLETQCDEMIALALAGDHEALTSQIEMTRRTRARFSRSVVVDREHYAGPIRIASATVHDELGLAVVLISIEVVIASVLAVLLSGHLSRRITHPVLELEQAVRRLGTGDLTARAVVKAPRELASLVRAFDQMADFFAKIVDKSETEQAHLRGRIQNLLKSEKQLRHEAMHDTLTGLANRTVLTDHLDRCIAKCDRAENYGFSLLFLDLDRFKVVNDSLGHNIGDELLKEAASRLIASVRGMDTVIRVEEETTARLGGDEFAILLDGVKNPGRAVVVAERIQQRLNEPFMLDGHEISVTTSIGIAISHGQEMTAAGMLRDADTAMYRAKMTGGRQHAIFDDDMHADVKARLALENDFRKGIEEQQFLVEYQPIVDVVTGEIMAFEALVRWEQDGQPRIPPSKFVPIAEETGLIVPLGRQVMHQALRQLAAWREQLPEDHPVAMSINVSPRQIRDVDVAAELDQLLADLNLEGRHVRIEITESLLIDDDRSVMVALKAIKKLGCQLYMDDFGTGYSSLSCLHRFPIDVLKVDREFILNFDADRTYAAVVRAIMTMAHALGMRVTAEGIETADQLALVRSLRCEYGQGYYFARPLGPAAAWEILRSGIPLRPVSRQSA